MKEYKKSSEMIKIAEKYAGEKEISPFISTGQATSVILTSKNNIYVGKSILTRCSQGVCAEQNAIANMLTNDESEIVRVLCLDRNLDIRMPCGICREYLMQLGPGSENIEVLKSNNKYETVILKHLLPRWWGKERYARKNSS